MGDGRRDSALSDDSGWSGEESCGTGREAVTSPTYQVVHLDSPRRRRVGAKSRPPLRDAVERSCTPRRQPRETVEGLRIPCS